jgi:uncharacterized iron-regulated membrane protein
MKNKLTMRILHRYLGFFLAGIMAVYALSGILLVFRNTDFLKTEQQFEEQLAPNIKNEDLSKEFGMKSLKISKEKGDLVYFQIGTYNKKTGLVNYKEKDLPYLLSRMTHLHKASTDDPLYWLNIFFGFALLFFVISAFWMFMPKTKVFTKGLYFTLGGIVLTLVLLFF